MIFVSRKSEMADERKDTFGKERTKGVRVRGSFDSRGRVSSYFFLYFVVVTFLLSSREEVEEEVDDDTGSLTRSKARVLPFFFSWRVRRFLKILEKSMKSAILNLGELMLFFQTNKSQLCSRPWVLAS